MDIGKIFDDLLNLENECHERRLIRASKWCSELAFHIARHPDSKEKIHLNERTVNNRDTMNSEEKASLRFAQACMDNDDYGQAAHCTQSYRSSHSVLRFIHYYARFLAIEKARGDNMADVADKNIQVDNSNMVALYTELEKFCSTSDHGIPSVAMASADVRNLPLDAFILYLYGLVQKELLFKTEALTTFTRALHLHNGFWPAWQEAAKLINSKDEVSQFPNHWLNHFFSAEAYLSLQMYAESLQVYGGLRDIPALGDSPYVLTQMAIAHHHLQDVDSVVEAFRTVRNQYPYRLDQVDLLSNSLFVKGMRAELAELAHHCTDVSKYCPETCLVVGNYYSLRGEHDKAVIYFQRALKLDSRKSDAWTLLGHEFMELKNTAAATLSYRKALEIDPRDYRAWYGLGQHYDILKMPNYAMYYYGMAQKVQPHDSRMIIALGEMFEKQGKYEEARKCYWKAHLVGDIEGQALLRLGKLYEKMKNADQAAAAYAMYLAQLDDSGTTVADQQPQCYRFLADYHTTRLNLDDAHHYAQLCLEFDSTKEEARGLLRRISQLRNASNGSAENHVSDA